jgi:hypothetical protein
MRVNPGGLERTSIAVEYALQNWMEFIFYFERETDTMNNLMRFISVAVIGLILFAAPAAAASCGSIASLSLPDGNITSATLVAAGEFNPPMRFLNRRLSVA